MWRVEKSALEGLTLAEESAHYNSPSALPILPKDVKAENLLPKMRPNG